MITDRAILIAVDWGTSRLRARLLDEGARVIDAAESGDGIGRIDGNQPSHRAVLTCHHFVLSSSPLMGAF